MAAYRFILSSCRLLPSLLRKEHEVGKYLLTDYLLMYLHNAVIITINKDHFWPSPSLDQVYLHMGQNIPPRRFDWLLTSVRTSLIQTETPKVKGIHRAEMKQV